MTPERRGYILKHLAQDKKGNWIRITETELESFGGDDFFEGCTIDWTNRDVFTCQAGQRGWAVTERMQLPWKITAPPGGFHPQYKYGEQLDPELAAEIMNAINEGNTMEHHVNREKIIEVLTEAKVEYQDLYTRFKDLYFGVATSRLSAYVDGEIPHTSPVLPCDDKGVIAILPDLSDRYNDMILAMQLDVREVIEMTEGEFEAFAEHRGVDNSRQLTETIARLERLS